MAYNKETGKKPYLTDVRYPDFMRTGASKGFWNTILEVAPRLREFAKRPLRTLTSFERSVARFLEQSNFKKPYFTRKEDSEPEDYPEMEWYLDPPSGIWPPFPPWIPDQPWNFPDPPSDPSVSIFDAESDSCWCQGETRPLVITGTHPIYGIHVSWIEDGSSVNITGGFGTNKITGTITASDDQGGFITIEVLMQTSYGVPGDSNVNIFECRDCCPDPTDFADSGSNPATIAQSSSAGLSVVGGKGPYSWGVSGSGFTLDPSTGLTNTLYTDGSACGTATITVTDNCGETVTIEVRSTVGSWNLKSSGSCVVAGTPTSIESSSASHVTYLLISGGKRQRQRYNCSRFCSSGPPCSCTAPDFCAVGGFTYGECIIMSCPDIGYTNKSIVGFGNVCCDRGSGGTLECRGCESDILQYAEWEC